MQSTSPPTPEPMRASVSDWPSAGPDGQMSERPAGRRDILQLLRACGLTEATVALAIGTTRQSLQDWEHSLAAQPPVARLQELAAVLWHCVKRAPSPRDVGRWLCVPSRHLVSRRPLEILPIGECPW